MKKILIIGNERCERASGETLARSCLIEDTEYVDAGFANEMSHCIVEDGAIKACKSGSWKDTLNPSV